MTNPGDAPRWHDRRRARWAWFVLMGVLVVLAIRTLSPYKPRFESELLGDALNMLVALALAASAWVLALAQAQGWRRRVSVVGASMLMVPCMVVVAINAFELATAESPRRESIDTLVLSPQVRLHLYRTDCGATCAYGLVLHKEIDTGVGLVFERKLWSRYRASDGRLQMQADGRAVEVWPDRSDKAVVALD